ncbi:endonuclease MutS2 [Clostridium aminobutyricum]|uniref:Endonuclease MutS2 n=1 Tax=Clostridium aminobutyricum TaxID=33953 RepID=A0A939DA72_CLOAM|nr:endonuclease MutS2 [Clostridium aminobutyricum]MBN7774234.1 endonuclease MutS2 [Clostridium aminobutyricum]
MNQKTYRVLEYNKIMDQLKAEAASEMAKKIISDMKPLVDVTLIEELLAETTEAVSVIVHKGNLPLGSFYDIEDSLHLARKGATLNMKQLLQILYNLHVAQNVFSFLKSDLPRLPIIHEISELISIQKNLEANIDRCILSEDEMSDNASPDLKQIRRSIIRQNEAVRNKMNQILNSSDNRTLLQDAIVTMRQGRFVIPVKQEHKAKFPGIVHDQSSTGATLFIEPQAIVTLNNELRELELAEKAEMERILAELSSNVAEHYHEILNNQELLIKLDLIFAKGKLSLRHKGTDVKLSEEGVLDIKNGRHPLLNQAKVVPINVSLGKEYDTLVITGPNTGGKTVTLKTVGLLAMMIQSGLHIPASSGSTMPVFTKIYADIGDEQSIEQSLSTFSSHMNNIVDIVQSTDSETLVLLDELGAGTDPTEGAALAIAVLDDLYSKGAHTIATTHYTELKKYAIETHGVQNASMEFNVETLSPTYKLTIGIPGKSNAFEISEKLGLPSEIIRKARTLLDKGEIEFENVITQIEEDKKLAEAERDEAILINSEMKRQKDELDKRLKKLEEQKEHILMKAREEARDMVREAKELADQVQKELKDLDKMDSAAERHALYNENRRRIKSVDSKYRETIQTVENQNPIDASKLKVGDRVKVLTMGQNGELLSLPDDKGDLFVQIGSLKAKINIKSLMLINDGTKKKAAPKTSKYGNLYRSKAQNISLSINVRGKNLDDAVMDVDKYLDDAYMAGLKEVTVIHGRGEGILRTGLHEIFKKHKHVDSYRKGAFNEGGDGVTVVTLK